MDNDERNHPPHVLRALGRLPAEEVAPGITLTTRKDPIIPTIEALEDKQRCIDYWGHRAEKAEDERDRLRDALRMIMENSPVESYVHGLAKRALAA